MRDCRTYGAGRFARRHKISGSWGRRQPVREVRGDCPDLVTPVTRCIRARAQSKVPPGPIVGSAEDRELEDPAAAAGQTGLSDSRRCAHSAVGVIAMEANVYDVVVVGGGAAGLSAALVLGRARRRVAVVDAGSPRNAAAAHMQGFLSRDGMRPADLLAAGRAEVTGYGVELVEDQVVGIDAGFVVRLAA